MKLQKKIWFVLRREPMYHKIQYSKTPKFDIAAAVFGVVVGAFVVYMTLSTVGSGGADLSDLTVLAWYSFIFFFTLKTYLFLQRDKLHKNINSYIFFFIKDVVSLILNKFFLK